MQRPAFVLATILPLALGLLQPRTSAAQTNPGQCGPGGGGQQAPVGLSFFFQNGEISPITLVGDAPRFIQELDITAEVTTSTDQGVEPLIQSGALGHLDWTGIEFVEDRWTQPGDGTWEHMRFYRGARWMKDPSQFVLLGVDKYGFPVGEPITFNGGVDDYWNQERDDGFVRRFNVRQVIQGCQAYNDCSNVTSYVVQGLVQGRQEQFPQQVARQIPQQATRLQLFWNQDPITPRTVEISHASPSAYPFGYGFQPSITVLNPPANGKYYLPGDALSVKVAFYDGQGNLINTPGSLPTYQQANIDDDQGLGAGGIRYWDPTINAVLYYALKHREANMTLGISGPTNKLQVPKTVVPVYALFPPETISATVPVDGFSAEVVFIPGIAEILGPLAGYDTPVSDTQTINVPSDAQPGTYTIALKARRNWAGEALDRGVVISIPVGQATPTSWTPTTGNCQNCHQDRSSLSIVNHGIEDRRSCFGCHPGLGFEPDNVLDWRVHGIHSRSERFPANFNDCSTCHLTPPTGPAVGQYTGPDPDK